MRASSEPLVRLREDQIASSGERSGINARQACRRRSTIQCRERAAKRPAAPLVCAIWSSMDIVQAEDNGQQRDEPDADHARREAPCRPSEAPSSELLAVIALKAIGRRNQHWRIGCSMGKGGTAAKSVEEGEDGRLLGAGSNILS